MADEHDPTADERPIADDVVEAHPRDNGDVERDRHLTLAMQGKFDG